MDKAQKEVNHNSLRNSFMNFPFASNPYNPYAVYQKFPIQPPLAINPQNAQGNFPFVNQQTASTFQGVYNPYINPMWLYYSQAMMNNQIRGNFPILMPPDITRSNTGTQQKNGQSTNLGQNNLSKVTLKKITDRQYPAQDHIVLEDQNIQNDYNDLKRLQRMKLKHPNKDSQKQIIQIGAKKFTSLNKNYPNKSRNIQEPNKKKEKPEIPKKKSMKLQRTQSRNFSRKQNLSIIDLEEEKESKNEPKQELKKASFNQQVVKQSTKLSQQKEAQNPLQFVNKIEEYIKSFEGDSPKVLKNNDDLDISQDYNIQSQQSQNNFRSQKESTRQKEIMSSEQPQIQKMFKNASKYIEYYQQKPKNLIKNYSVAFLEEICSSQRQLFMLIESQIVARVWLTKGYGFQKLNQYMNQNSVKFYWQYRNSPSFKKIEFSPVTKYNSKCEIICRMMMEMIEFFLESQCRAKIHKITQEEFLCLLPYLMNFLQILSKKNIQTLTNVMNIVLALKNTSLKFEDVQVLYLSLMEIVDQKFPNFVSRGTKPFMNVSKFQVVLFFRQSIKKFALNSMVRLSPKFKELWKNEIEAQFAKRYVYVQLDNKHPVQTFGCCLHLKKKYPLYNFYFTTFNLRRFFLKRLILKCITKLKQAIGSCTENLPTLTHIGSDRSKDILKKRGYRKLRCILVRFYLENEYSQSKLANYIKDINIEIRKEEAQRGLLLAASLRDILSENQQNLKSMEGEKMKKGSRQLKNLSRTQRRPRIISSENQEKFDENEPGYLLQSQEEKQCQSQQEEEMSIIQSQQEPQNPDLVQQQTLNKSNLTKK